MGMANVRKHELEFLHELLGKMRSVDSLSDDCERLFDIVVRLESQRKRTNEKTAKIIMSKRKTDPCYARSKSEIDRIRKKEK